MREIQGKWDGTLGRIERIREEFHRLRSVVDTLPFGMAAHFGDAFNRLSGAFLAGGMEARMFGANVSELISDAESAAATQEQHKRAQRRQYVQRAAARRMGRQGVNA